GGGSGVLSRCAEVSLRRCGAQLADFRPAAGGGGDSSERGRVRAKARRRDVDGRGTVFHVRRSEGDGGRSELARGAVFGGGGCTVGQQDDVQAAERRRDRPLPAVARHGNLKKGLTL